MDLKFGDTRQQGINWRRELPPVIAVAGLAADYLSPAELWTILLPLACVMLLAGMRKWGTAALVFVLSSWVFVPLAAHTVTAIDDVRGERNMFFVPGEMTIGEVVTDSCDPADVGIEVLPIGPGHLINPRWALRETIVSVARLHNAIIAYRCEDPLAFPAR
jgi:hypothetical protein